MILRKASKGKMNKIESFCERPRKRSYLFENEE